MPCGDDGMRSTAGVAVVDSGLSLVQADNAITGKAYNYAKILSAATSSVPGLQTVFPANDGLASQLKQIRRSFRCGRRSRRRRLAFYQATQELGVASNVTTFTMSDFHGCSSRTQTLAATMRGDRITL